VTRGAALAALLLWSLPAAARAATADDQTVGVGLRRQDGRLEVDREPAA